MEALRTSKADVFGDKRGINVAVLQRWDERFRLVEFILSVKADSSWTQQRRSPERPIM